MSDGKRKQDENLYSTKPIRVRLPDRSYVVPANFFSPRHLHEPDVIQSDSFGFVLLLPHYEGFAPQDDASDRFEQRRIDVMRIAPPIGAPEPPDTQTAFERLRNLREDRPSLAAHGLEGYRMTGGVRQIYWAGRRTNGDFIYFRSSLAPGEPSPYAGFNPSCYVRYYSPSERLSVVYRYSQFHLPTWRAIDDAVWAKLRAWRVE